MVKYLVDEKSIDPLCVLGDRTTPFHLACQKGHLEIVKFFIEEKGCNPMYEHGKYQTPYVTACSGGHLDVVRYLTEERQCDPLAKDAEGLPQAVLAATVSNKNFGILKYFVEERGCDLKANGELALYFAIQSGNVQAFQYLSTGTSSAPVADQGKKRGASPVPQLQPPDEPPPSKRIKQDITENEAPPPNVLLSGPPHLLNPDDLAFLINHLQPMASQWRAFGLQLGLLPGDLDTAHSRWSSSLP